jgi:hypothetical protein
MEKFYEGVGCMGLRILTKYTAYFYFLACGLPQACNNSVAAYTSAHLLLRFTEHYEHYYSESPASTGFATYDGPC